MLSLDDAVGRAPTGESRDVVVQVAPEERQSAESLRQLPLATRQCTAAGTAVTVPLGEVARVEAGTAPAQINREDLERVATVSATTTPDVSLAEASNAIRDALARMTMPPGYSARPGGETEQLEETTGYVVEAILLAAILIFLILASQFESVFQPIVIMLSLPLSLIGVLLALLVTNDTLNMMSMIGGLITSTTLTLIVVPVAYSYFDDFSASLRRRAHLLGRAPAGEPVREPEHLSPRRA